MTDIHVDNADGLRAIRSRLALIRVTAANLAELGETGESRRMFQRAGDLAAATVWVPVECLLGPEKHFFEAAFPADGPAGIGVGVGICGPCSARVDAEIEKGRQACRQLTES